MTSWEPGALVKIIDILGHQRQMAAAFGEARLELGERVMGGVRLGLDQIAPSKIVKRQDARRVTGETFGGRELHRVEARPDPLALLVAERSQSALGRYAGAGEHKYIAGHSAPFTAARPPAW